MDAMTRQPYADLTPECERCGRPALDADGAEICLRCLDELRAEAAEEVHLSPMACRLAKAVRSMGRVYSVRVPGNERTAMLMASGQNGDA